MVTLTNILALGSCIGCLIASNFIVKGRRFSLIFFCIVIIITSALSITSYESLLFIARFIAGIA